MRKIPNLLLPAGPFYLDNIASLRQQIQNGADIYYQLTLVLQDPYIHLELRCHLIFNALEHKIFFYFFFCKRVIDSVIDTNISLAILKLYIHWYYCFPRGMQQ